VSTPRFQLVPGGRLVHEPAAGGVGWRLLGANNRELGRAAIAYPDAEAALSAVADVRELAAVGAAHILHDPATGSWAWHLLADDSRVIATSGRGFRHERECRYNLEQFREIAPTAPAADTGTTTEFPWQRLSADVLPAESAS
jgi:uncharacterized protein YegP (UPF0339 family)